MCDIDECEKIKRIFDRETLEHRYSAAMKMIKELRKEKRRHAETIKAVCESCLKAIVVCEQSDGQLKEWAKEQLNEN